MTAPSAPEVPTDQKKKEGLPGWLAVVLIAGAVAVGAGILWNFWQSMKISGGGATVQLDEKPSERLAVEAQNRAQFFQRQRAERQAAARKQELEGPDYLRPRPANTGGWIAKGGKTQVVITKGNNGQVRVQLSSLDPDFVTPEQRNLLSIAIRATTDDALAKQLNITPEQKTALTGLPRGGGYPVDPNGRKRLESLFTAWEQAPEADKPAKSAAFTQATKELEAQYAEKTKTAITDAIAKIKSTLTPDQLKGLGG